MFLSWQPGGKVMATNRRAGNGVSDPDSPLLKILQPGDLAAIDQALARIGMYGEVHLVVEKGRLRYIRTVRSEAVVGNSDPQWKNSQ